MFHRVLLVGKGRRFAIGLCTAALVASSLSSSVYAASSESSVSYTYETDTSEDEGSSNECETTTPEESSVSDDPVNQDEPSVPAETEQTPAESEQVSTESEDSYSQNDSIPTESEDGSQQSDSASDESGDMHDLTSDDSVPTDSGVSGAEGSGTVPSDSRKNPKKDSKKTKDKTTKKQVTKKQEKKDTATKDKTKVSPEESAAPTPAVTNESAPDPATYDTSYVYTNPIVVSNPFSFTATGFKAIGEKLLIIDAGDSFGNFGIDGEDGYLNIYDDTSVLSEVIGHLRKGAVVYSIADEDKEWRFIEAVDAEGKIIRGFCWSEYLKDAPEGVEVTEESAASVIKVSKVTYTKSFRYSLFTTQAELLKHIESAGDVVSRSGMVKYAEQFVGNPYVWGGESLTSGCDCSGFTMQIYRAFGIDLPRYSYEQAEVGMKISVQDALPGDLVFYSRDGQIYHVMMIAGKDEDGHPLVVHASSSTTGIIVSRLNLEKVCWACRIIEDPVYEEENFKVSEATRAMDEIGKDWDQNVNIESRFRNEFPAA
jgi:cell wall-associated NlpC family hydrolase